MIPRSGFVFGGLSITAVCLEELTLLRYRRTGDLPRLLTASVIEDFCYRRLSTCWHVKGLLARRRSWGSMVRNDFSAAAAPPA